jgi:hypothetical protein
MLALRTGCDLGFPRAERRHARGVQIQRADRLSLDEEGRRQHGAHESPQRGRREGRKTIGLTEKRNRDLLCRTHRLDARTIVVLVLDGVELADDVVGRVRREVGAVPCQRHACSVRATDPRPRQKQDLGEEIVERHLRDDDSIQLGEGFCQFGVAGLVRGQSASLLKDPQLAFQCGRPHSNHLWDTRLNSAEAGTKPGKFRLSSQPQDAGGNGAVPHS